MNNQTKARIADLARQGRSEENLAADYIRKALRENNSDYALKALKFIRAAHKTRHAIRKIDADSGAAEILKRMKKPPPIDWEKAYK